MSISMSSQSAFFLSVVSSVTSVEAKHTNIKEKYHDNIWIQRNNGTLIHFSRCNYSKLQSYQRLAVSDMVITTDPVK